MKRMFDLFLALCCQSDNSSQYSYDLSDIVLKGGGEVHLR